MELKEGQVDEAELDAIFNEDSEDKVEAVTEVTAEAETSGGIVEEVATEIVADSAEKESVEVVEETPDPLSDFDALKKEFDSLNHKYKSDEGRVSALQRQINELQKVNNTLKARQVAPRPVAKPSRLDSGKIVDDLYSGDEEKAKAAVEALVSHRPAAVGNGNVEQTVNKMVQPLFAAEKARAKAQQEQVLESTYPDWREQVNSEEFSSWVSGLAAPIRQLVNSDDAQDAIQLLKYFNSTKGVSTSVGSGKSEVEKLKEKRGKQLSGGTAPSSKHNASVSGGMPSDPDALFDYLERNDPDLKTAYGR
jgi:hypothetical protein